VVEATRETPTESLNNINGVVELTSIFEPAVDKERGTSLCHNVLGVAESTELEVGKSPRTIDVGTVEYHAETVLLTVSSVKNVVSSEVNDSKDDIVSKGELLVQRVVESVDGLSGVDKSDTGKVPEGKHPTPLLVEDVPRGGNAIFTLHDSVGVHEVSENHEGHIVRDETVQLELFDSGGHSDEEEHDPGYAHLSKHLDIEGAKTRVENSTHEEIIDDIARAILSSETKHKTGEIDKDSDDISRNHGDHGKRTEIINNFSDGEDIVPVEDEDQDQGDIPRAEGITEILELTTTLAGDRKTLHGDTGKHNSHKDLSDLEHPVDSECVGGRGGVVAERVAEVGTPLLEGLDRQSRREDEGTVVVVQAQINIRDNEVGKCNQAQVTNRTTELGRLDLDDFWLLHGCTGLLGDSLGGSGSSSRDNRTLGESVLRGFFVNDKDVGCGDGRGDASSAVTSCRARASANMQRLGSRGGRSRTISTRAGGRAGDRSSTSNRLHVLRFVIKNLLRSLLGTRLHRTLTRGGSSASAAAATTRGFISLLCSRLSRRCASSRSRTARWHL